MERLFSVQRLVVWCHMQYFSAAKGNGDRQAVCLPEVGRLSPSFHYVTVWTPLDYSFLIRKMRRWD